MEALTHSAESIWWKNGDHPGDYLEPRLGFEGDTLREFSGQEAKANGWEGGVVRYFRHPSIDGSSACPTCGYTYHDHGWIDVSDTKVCPGSTVKGIYASPPGFRRRPGGLLDRLLHLASRVRKAGALAARSLGYRSVHPRR